MKSLVISKLMVRPLCISRAFTATNSAERTLGSPQRRKGLPAENMPSANSTRSSIGFGNLKNIGAPPMVMRPPSKSPEIP